jgi:uncharacterized protein
VGCRKRAARSELLRVVAVMGTDDRLVVRPDPAKTALGRGAYLHPSTACYDLAVRRKAFSRALRARSAVTSFAVREYLDRSN